ncbi:MAG: hypothetical protein H7282_09490 [Cytophagaceae bacterium]|nr:hypothetical protein [Cytophagaceae bacterium]
MKYLIFICIFFASQASFSQDCTDCTLIGFGCGEAGIPSIAVQQISEHIDNGDCESLKAFINSADPSLKYLSVKVCDYKVKKNKMVLTTQEKNSIELAKQSEEKIEYCSGCTISKIYTLKELFRDDSIDLNISLIEWIKRIDK